LTKNDHRKTFLLLASYAFYASWDWRFVMLLILLASGDYFFALRIASTQSEHARRLFVAASLTMNLGALGFFKYFNFFLDNAVSLASALGVTLSRPTLDIILPVGISFFTFQSLSYTIDVYRRHLEPSRNMRDYLLVAAFFPQLVAGPITRPSFFLPQLLTPRVVSSSDIRAMLLLFFIGYVKKACIADNVAPFVDRVFDAPDGFDGIASVAAVWLYATQIYCDFSGYSDMAIAAAGLMGYRLTLNFNGPYISTSLQEFWRRWHISLSTWIRDYIYISLGGRSIRRGATYRNLLVTMLAAGLWHGAAWTFVWWGGLHGLGLIVNREVRRHLPERKSEALAGRVLGWLMTINFVCVAWIFFRAGNFSTARILLEHYFFLSVGGSQTLPLWLIGIGPALLALQFIARQFGWADKISALGPVRFALAYGGAWALAIALVPLSYRPFIYFQF